MPWLITGYAKATLRIMDDDQDVTYVSDRVKLGFFQRAFQGGNTQYVLYGVPTGYGSAFTPSVVRWIARGKKFDCTVEGESTVTLDVADDVGPGYAPHGVYTPLDPTRLVFGTLNIVGPDSGDFHSVMVKALNPDAKLIKVCPGDPPAVTEEPFEAGYLLHIVWHKNAYEGDNVVLKGKQEYDEGSLYDFLNLLPPVRHFRK